MHWPHHFHNLPAFLASHSSLRSLDDCCSVTKSCSTFCDFMDYSVPGSQGTLKSLLQHHSSKASVLQHSAFFMVQLSYPYMTTGKTIALTIQAFVGKVMPLLFNILSSLVTVFLPRSKSLLISCCSHHQQWFWSPPQNKVSPCFHSFPICLPWSDGTRRHDLSFLNV